MNDHLQINLKTAIYLYIANTSVLWIFICSYSRKFSSTEKTAMYMNSNAWVTLQALIWYYVSTRKGWSSKHFTRKMDLRNFRPPLLSASLYPNYVDWNVLMYTGYALCSFKLMVVVRILYKMVKIRNDYVIGKCINLLWGSVCITSHRILILKHSFHFFVNPSF